MERQLELSDIAMYLPYGLKAMFDHGRIEEISTLSDGCLNIKGRGTAYGMFSDISDCKPLLRSFASITDAEYKELGYEKYSGSFGIVEYAEYGESPKCVVNPIDYLFQINKMLELHIDVNDLIGQGLAIDINTIQDGKA